MVLRDTARLRAFALVTDLGSISAAADVLGYTQSAVSQQIAALEREVGVPLVDRSQRPLRPTAAGAGLRPHVERVLAAVGAADAVVEDLRGGLRRLRLAAFPSALSSFVPAAVRDLRRDDPEVVIHVLQLETQEAIEALRAGAAELAVVHHLPGVARPDLAGLRRTELLEDGLHLVLPENHRLARKEQIAVADLEGEPLVLPRRDTPAGRHRSLIEHLCAQAGFAPLVAYDVDDLPAAQAFAAAGIGLVPMHGLTLATLPPGATARPLDDGGAAARLVEIVAPEAAIAPAAAALLATLRLAAARWRR